MTDHQHAADPAPDEGTRSDARPVPTPGDAPPAPTPGKEPRAHASAHERADARAELGKADRPGPSDAAPDEPGFMAADQPGSTPGGPSTEKPRPTADQPGPTTPGRPGSAADGGPAPAAEAGSPDAAVFADVPRRFRRERGSKMLAGVCAGLGRQCDIDPVIFRITLAVLAATGGIGLIFYGFAWLLVPYDDDEENELRKLLTGRVDGQALAAVLFALVGCGVFLTMLNNGGVLTFAVVLSLLLAGAGYWSQRRRAPDPDPLAAQAAADAPPEAKAPPVPTAYPSWWRDPIIKDGTHVGGTGYLWGPRDSRDRDIAAAVNVSLGTPWAQREDIRTPRPPVPRPRGPRWIGGWLFLLALLAGALGTGLTWNDQALGTSLQTGLSYALIVLGVGIAVSALLGRTGAGSVFLAIVTAALLAASAALPKDISTHWVRKEWRPVAVADVRPKYDLGTGVATLDLTSLPLSKGHTVTTAAEVGLGKLKVIVPKDVTVKADIQVGVGDIQLPGDNQKDVDVEPDKHQQVTLSPAAGTKSRATVDLDLKVGAGQAEVSRATS